MNERRRHPEREPESQLGPFGHSGGWLGFGAIGVGGASGAGIAGGLALVIVLLVLLGVISGPGAGVLFLAALLLAAASAFWFYQRKRNARFRTRARIPDDADLSDAERRDALRSFRRDD
jgi:hypothetical protein